MLLGDTEKRERVQEALLILAHMGLPISDAGGTGTCSEENIGQTSDNAKILACFLRKFFLGIMDFITALLLKNTSDMQASFKEKEDVLESLGVLIHLIGPHLNLFRLKVIATLRLVLQFPQLVERALHVWYDFVKCLDIGQVGPVLGQIVVDLLPHLRKETGQVVRILDYLIVENHSHLQPYLHEVPLLPDVPALCHIRKLLEDQAARDWKVQIEQLISGAQHESADVRLLALDRLLGVLADKREELVKCIMGEAVPLLISRIMRVLFVCARDSSREQKVRVARCLGELGAIDPGRVDLDLRTEAPRAAPEQKELIDGEGLEDDLPFYLVLNYLVPALRATRDTRGQDRAAYAIQEILKATCCTEQTPILLAQRQAAKAAYASGKKKRKTSQTRKLPSEVKRGLRFFRRFPEDVQEILRPFLSSKYVLRASASLQPSPCYAHARDYQTWVVSWTSNLIQRAQAPQAPFFTACRGVIKDDMPTALFLLPHLVINVLRYGTDDDLNTIKMEFLSVLHQNEHQGDATNESSHEHPQQHEESQQRSQSVPALRSQQSQMSAQTIFSLMGLLHRWIGSHTPAPNRSARTGRPIRFVTHPIIFSQN